MKKFIKKCLGKIKKKINELKYGNPCMIASKTHIRRCVIGKYVNVAYMANIDNSSIGERSSIGRYTTIKKSTIGRFCSISWNCTIGAPSHPMEKLSGAAAFYQQRFGIVENDAGTSFTERDEKTIIGNDVWIGCNTVIRSGINVGDGAVIGAGSIVTHDVLPYSIVAGVPAKVIGMRFPEDVVEQLIKIRWWDWSEEKIKNNLDLFYKTVTVDMFDNVKE